MPPRIQIFIILTIFLIGFNSHAAIVEYEATGTVTAVVDPQGDLSDIDIVAGNTRFTARFSYDTDVIPVSSFTNGANYTGISFSVAIDAETSIIELKQGAPKIQVLNDNPSLHDFFTFVGETATKISITGLPLLDTNYMQIVFQDSSNSVFISPEVPQELQLSNFSLPYLKIGGYRTGGSNDDYFVISRVETLTRLSYQPPLNVLLTPTEAASFDTDGDGQNDLVDPLPSDPNVAVDSDGDGTPDRFDPAPTDPAYSSSIDGQLVTDKKPPLDFFTLEGEPLSIGIIPKITDRSDDIPGAPTLARHESPRDPLAYVGVDLGNDGVIDGFVFFKITLMKTVNRSILFIPPPFFTSSEWDLTKPGTYNFRLTLFVTTGLEHLEFSETATVTVERAGVVNIFETGLPPGPNGVALRADQWLAHKFTITDDYTVTDVSGYMLGEGYPASVIAAIYTDGAVLPGTKLYSQSFDIKSTDPYNYGWEGATGLNWYLTPGTYWLAFEVPGDYSGGMLRTGPLCCTRVAYTAFDDQWRLGGYYRLGIRIDGIPNDAVCGNGTLELGEQCDDGNLIDGDMCSATCTSEHISNFSPEVSVQMITNVDGTVDYSFLSNSMEIIRIENSNGLLDLSNTTITQVGSTSSSGEPYASTNFSLNPEMDLASAGATKSLVSPYLDYVCAVDDPAVRVGTKVGCDSRSPGYVYWPVSDPCGEPGSPAVGRSLAGTPLPQYTCEKLTQNGQTYAKVSGLVNSLVASISDLDSDGYPAEEDCDNDNPGVFPGAIELPDGLDNDCNGLVDEGFNLPPAANAGNDQSVVVGSTVSLDGSASADVDSSGSLSFQWIMLSKPETSIVTIVNPQSANSGFVADVEGTYEVLLVVDDGELSGLDSLTITAFKATEARVIDAVNEIISSIEVLSPDVFSNKNHQKTFINKLNPLLSIIEKREYQDAYDKLTNDLLDKTGGCAIDGEVDKNDWITTCEAQAQVYPLVIKSLDYLVMLIQDRLTALR